METSICSVDFFSGKTSNHFGTSTKGNNHTCHQNYNTSTQGGRTSTRKEHNCEEMRTGRLHPHHLLLEEAQQPTRAS
jgi:hypothetical protein